MPLAVGVHVAVYGNTASVPRATPLARNCTLATVPGATAAAVAVMVAVELTATVDRVVGAVMLTVG